MAGGRAEYIHLSYDGTNVHNNTPLPSGHVWYHNPSCTERTINVHIECLLDLLYRNISKRAYTQRGLLVTRLVYHIPTKRCTPAQIPPALFTNTSILPSATITLSIACCTLSSLVTSSARCRMPAFVNPFIDSTLRDVAYTVHPLFANSSHLIEDSQIIRVWKGSRMSGYHYSQMEAYTT